MPVFLTIYLISILNAIRVFLLDWWRPQRPARNPNGLKRTFFNLGLVPMVVFLVPLGIGIGLVSLVWTVPMLLIALGIGIALAPALRRRMRTAMTEQDWHECTRPWVMLEFACRRSRDWKRHLLSWFGYPRFRLSSRKLRRVSEAACRA